jgi:hypothetical protein
MDAQNQQLFCFHGTVDQLAAVTGLSTTQSMMPPPPPAAVGMPDAGRPRPAERSDSVDALGTMQAIRMIPWQCRHRARYHGDLYCLPPLLHRAAALAAAAAAAAAAVVWPGI